MEEGMTEEQAALLIEILRHIRDVLKGISVILALMLAAVASITVNSIGK